MTGYVRNHNGFPSLIESREIICAAHEGRIEYREAFERARALELHRGSCDVHLSAATMRYLSPNAAVPTSAQLAAAACEQIMRSEFTRRLVACAMDMDAYPSRKEMDSHMRACAESLRPKFATIGESLAADPSARSLRAPQSTSGATSAEAWLRQPLG